MWAIVAPSISAKATCIDGIAANGLKSRSAEPESAFTPVKAATESVKPHSGMKRGGAVGSADVADQRDAHRDHEHVAHEVEALVAAQVDPGQRDAW